MKLMAIAVVLMISVNVKAENMIRVEAIGSSPKGQFIAFEEFGYLDQGKAPFSRIRVKNVWKNRYMNQPIKIVTEESKGLKLEQIRAKTKQLAREKLKKYDIST